MKQFLLLEKSKRKNIIKEQERNANNIYVEIYLTIDNEIRMQKIKEKAKLIRLGLI